MYRSGKNKQKNEPNGNADEETAGLASRRAQRVCRLAGGSAFSTRVLANAPPPEPVTQALIDAAKKEGKVAYYTSVDLPVAENLAKAFEAKYSGISVRTERTGAERVFQRIGQEYSSNIHAVDVVNSSDAAHFHGLEARRR